MLKDLMNAVGAVDHPFLKPGRENAPKGVILMTADKGLAGAFNSNVIRLGEQTARQNPNLVWYAVGNKARNSVKRFSPAIRLRSLAFGRTQNRNGAAHCGACDRRFRRGHDLRDHADFLEARFDVAAASRGADARTDRGGEGRGRERTPRSRRVLAVARGRADPVAAQVPGIYDLLGHARDRRGVFRRAVDRDEQRDRQRRQTDRRTDPADEQSAPNRDHERDARDRRRRRSRRRMTTTPTRRGTLR